MILSKKVFITAGLLAIIFTVLTASFRSVFFYDLGQWFLGFHTLIELFKIIIGLSLAIYIFSTYDLKKSNQFLFLGGILLITGILSIFHTLTFGGMVKTLIFPSQNIAMCFTLFENFVLAAGFLVVGFIKPVLPIRKKLLLLTTVLISFSLVIGFLSIVNRLDAGGASFFTISGPSGLKLLFECAILILMVANIIVYCRRYKKLTGKPPYYLLTFFTLTIISEIFFAFFSGTYASTMLYGHIFRSAAYVFLFLCLFPSICKFCQPKAPCIK